MRTTQTERTQRVEGAARVAPCEVGGEVEDGARVGASVDTAFKGVVRCGCDECLASRSAVDTQRGFTYGAAVELVPYCAECGGCADMGGCAEWCMDQLMMEMGPARRLTLKQVRLELAEIGVMIRSQCGEYRVYRRGDPDLDYWATTLDDARSTAMANWGG